MNGLVSTCFDEWVAWQKRRKMRGNTNWAHSRTTSTVWNGKCFVQVEVTHIGSDVTWIGKPYLSVHVGTIHINLTSIFVND